MSESRVAKIVKWSLRSVVLLIGVVVLAGTGCVWWWTSVAVGAPVDETPSDDVVHQRIESDVRFLAKPRSDDFEEHYDASSAYLISSLEKMGWEVHSENVPGLRRSFPNIWVELEGESEQMVVVGAHYDGAYDTPGADDNASGTAIGLELARRLVNQRPKRTIVIAFFANEEPPHFRTERMGSHVMAARLSDAGADLCVMISLEMLGFFTEEPDSQKYPPVLSWFYPSTGNFVGFVTDMEGRPLVESATEAFHEKSSLAAHGFSGPKTIQGIDYSDHMPFWNQGFHAMMITDTSFFRNPHYHKETDTPDTLNFPAMVQVASGVENVVRRLAFSDRCPR